MKSIILAAGYATRLYPLTENFPKPLLKIGEKSILDRLIDDLDDCNDITEHIIVSNHKFIAKFNSWAENRIFKHPVTIIDDGSVDNDNRLGAVKDIAFAIDYCSIKDSAIVLAGDNVLDFSLKDFIAYHKIINASVIMRHYENKLDKLQRTGVAIIDTNDKVIEMQEKPKIPKSNWAVPPFYIYKKDDLFAIKNAVSNNLCGTDAPGDFISWFCKNYDLYSWKMKGKRYDIGNLESYENVIQLFLLGKIGRN